MSEIKTEWRKRDAEWIKANPKKPTMYKVNSETGEEIEVDVKKTVFRPATKKPLPKEVTRFGFKSATDYAAATNVGGPRLKDGSSGIYAIICEIEKHAYVGQSISMDNRLRNHKMNILNPVKSDASYKVMRKHFEEHGIEAFQFIKVKELPLADQSILLDEEGKEMARFMRDGYALYNRDLPREIIDECILCPHEFRETIKALIQAIKDGRIKSEDVFNLIRNKKA